MRIWRALLALAVVDAVWAAARGWSITPASVGWTAVALFAFMLPLAIPRYRDDAKIATTLRAVVQLVLFTKIGALLSYLVAASPAPLVDAQLESIDAWLGFGWHAVADALASRPRLQTVLVLAYYSGLPQIGAVALLLGFTGRRESLEAFIWRFVVLTVITIVISGLLPAAGYKPPSHLGLLRAGEFRTVDFAEAQGLISMPSLHAGMAVLLAHAMRGVRGWFPVFLALDALMIAATPIEGGHYLIDVIAGSLLAGAVIAATRPTGLRQVVRGAAGGPLEAPPERAYP